MTETCCRELVGLDTMLDMELVMDVYRLPSLARSAEPVYEGMMEAAVEPAAMDFQAVANSGADSLEKQSVHGGNGCC